MPGQLPEGTPDGTQYVMATATAWQLVTVLEGE